MCINELWLLHRPDIVQPEDVIHYGISARVAFDTRLQEWGCDGILETVHTHDTSNGMTQECISVSGAEKVP